MAASQKTSRMFTTTAAALMTALADRAELDKTINELARSLADAAGIPANYPIPAA